MTTHRPHVGQKIQDWVEGRHGLLSEMLSTLRYQVGDGGMIREFVGYVVENDDDHMLTYLPIRDAGNPKSPKMNGENHVTMLEVSRRHVISLASEIVLASDD
ncbi:hypothetical protein KNU79_gp68 [Gordonia phage NadineRae]|uniref:Uncharacterized protein n=1 Tax=Gordonia phage NadineRae TaxID=2652882 RepID=A0A5P8DG51_9CAUD|nr:hypothetical protein KNU79_gp68 [Gordonia phage NadineRae]QFP97751.1 hypothetical protein SEA_NADINERAE_68 [Gordonia phage NadineRae]